MQADEPFEFSQDSLEMGPGHLQVGVSSCSGIRCEKGGCVHLYFVSLPGFREGQAKHHGL